jgi:hypothetical protein
LALPSMQCCTLRDLMSWRRIVLEDDAAKKPAKGLSGPIQGQGYGLSGTKAPPPPPLVPFAGCDRKAMPPSPAKPFAMMASPLKPSPMKDRIETATQAVARKAFAGKRQARIDALFGTKQPAANHSAPPPALAPPHPAPERVDAVFGTEDMDI